MSAAVGVLFCDQVDSTRLLTSLGDERAEELRRDVFAVLHRAVAVTRGDVVKGTGDGLMVVFRGDTTDAVACAVLMQRGVARLSARDTSVSLGLRVGLSRGETIFDGGDWFGAAVNLAARLCAAAASGGILAGEHVVTEADAGFVWDGERVLDLKGFPEPVMARELVWERPSLGAGLVLQPQLDVDGRGPFVGRDEQVGSLVSAWQRARSGERLVRLVGGEAGVGVTRVLAELAARVGDSGTVLFGTCGPGMPALAQMVRWWAASRTRAELANDTRHVSDEARGLDPSGGAAARRGRGSAGVVGFVARGM